MGQSWCGKHKNKEDRKIEDRQFVCATCGSKTICNSCLKIPKDWLTQWHKNKLHTMVGVCCRCVAWSIGSVVKR